MVESLQLNKGEVLVTAQQGVGLCLPFHLFFSATISHPLSLSLSLNRLMNRYDSRYGEPGSYRERRR